MIFKYVFWHAWNQTSLYAQYPLEFFDSNHYGPFFSIIIAKIHKCNNFLIFKYVFWHAWNQTSLYAQYPLEFFDSNHYGPFFSIIIAPFAVLPHPLGLFFWQVLMALALFVAIRKLPLR